MSDGIKPVTGPEAALVRLQEKLENWLLMQPEWVLLMGEGRAWRRRTAQRLAHLVFTIPARRKPV